MGKIINSWDELKGTNKILERDTMAVEEILTENNNNEFTLSWGELFVEDGYLPDNAPNAGEAPTENYAQNKTNNSIADNSTSTSQKTIQDSDTSTTNGQQTVENSNDNVSTSTTNEPQTVENSNDNVSASTANEQNQKDNLLNISNDAQELQYPKENPLNNCTIDKEPVNVLETANCDNFVKIEDINIAEEQDLLNDIGVEQQNAIQKIKDTLNATAEVIKETTESMPEIVDLVAHVELQQKTITQIPKTNSGFDFGDYNQYKVDSLEEVWHHSKQVLSSNTTQPYNKKPIGLSEIIDNSPLTFNPPLINPVEVRNQMTNRMEELLLQNDFVEPEVFTFTRITPLQTKPAELVQESTETIVNVTTNSQQNYDAVNDLGNQTTSSSSNELFNAACDAALESSKAFCEKTPEFVEKCETIKKSSLGVIESCKKTYQMILEYELMQSRGFWFTVFGFVVTGVTYLSYTGKLSFLSSLFKKGASETMGNQVNTPITTTNAPVINITNASPNTSSEFLEKGIIMQFLSTLLGTGMLGFFLKKAPTIINIVNKYSK